MKEYRNASGRLVIHLHDNGAYFEMYAARLQETCNATLLEQLDGLDQRYWNFDVDGLVVVLHADVFMGVSLSVSDGSCEPTLRSIADQVL